MSLRGTVSNSAPFTVINEYGKGAVVEMETMFCLVYQVACQGIV